MGVGCWMSGWGRFVVVLVRLITIIIIIRVVLVKRVVVGD